MFFVVDCYVFFFLGVNTDFTDYHSFRDLRLPAPLDSSLVWKIPMFIYYWITQSTPSTLLILYVIRRWRKSELQHSFSLKKIDKEKKKKKRKIYSLLRNLFI